jgi:D-sedoheptulose 7-phosphate isomerase
MTQSDEAARLFGLRQAPVRDLASQAGAVAGACHAMAVRFHRGGKLIAFGTGASSTDAQHVAVEFVHPVIVGKRALPAISLTTDVATVTGVATRDGVAGIFAHQIRYLAEPADIALGICAGPDSPDVRAGLEAARALGLLTVALAGAGRPGADGGTADDGTADGGTADDGRVTADHVIVARSADPRIIKELQVTTYHLLWELVHVFFEQPGLLDPAVGP